MTGSAGTREDELAAEYRRIRPRLLRAAYALLGTHAEAEDVVADTWPPSSASRPVSSGPLTMIYGALPCTGRRRSTRIH
jgi:hypothetical protein